MSVPLVPGVSFVPLSQPQSVPWDTPRGRPMGHRMAALSHMTARVAFEVGNLIAANSAQPFIQLMPRIARIAEQT